MSRIHWHPKTGEPRIFEDDEQEPEGWLNYHPKDRAKTGAADDEDDDGPGGNLSKREVMDALQSAGINFSSRDNLATLTAQLEQAVNDALAGMQISVTEGMSLRDRLALVEGQG